MRKTLCSILTAILVIMSPVIASANPPTQVIDVTVNMSAYESYLESINASPDINDFLRVDKRSDNPWYSFYSISLDLQDYPSLLYAVNEMNSADIVNDAYAYIQNNYYYDYEYQTESQTRIRPGGHFNLETLISTRTGLCGDVSIMYATILRSYGVPCKIIKNDTHVWNEVYINNRWVVVDNTVALGAEGRFVGKIMHGDPSLYETNGLIFEY